MTFQDQDNTTTFNLSFCRFLAITFVYGGFDVGLSQSLCPEISLQKFISSSNVFSITSSLLNSSGLLGRGIISALFAALPNTGVFYGA